jgi:tRNA threonylcarbamoyladenosine biosynthesis protein TsaB
MRILGIDTAGPIASVALVDEGNLVTEEFCGRDRAAGQSSSPALRGNHAEILLPLIQSVLAKSRCRFEDLAGVAVSIGPGSFTGLRIGLATVKGLAYEARLPVVGVSTLLATAACAKKFHGSICSMLDARKREVYAALFRSDGDHLVRLTDDAILSLQEAVACVRSSRGTSRGEVVLVGDGAVVHESFLIEALRPARVMAGGCRSVAAAVAALADESFRRCLGEDLGALAPVYLRPSEAESKNRGFDVTC